MNLRLLHLALLAPALSASAAIHSASETLAPSDKPAPLTVTGHWLAKHPRWKGSLEIRPDGTFSRSGGDGGKRTLTTENDQPVLQLDWDRWKTNRLTMVAPNLFRVDTGAGIFELRRAVEEAAAAPAKPAPDLPKEFDDPALKARLSDSVWELHDGKHFQLHADGTTTGSWHNRKGFWRIVGPNQVQLMVNWRQAAPDTVAVEADCGLLRWSDADWGQLAKRVETAREKR